MHVRGVLESSGSIAAEDCNSANWSHGYVFGPIDAIDFASESLTVLGYPVQANFATRLIDSDTVNLHPVQFDSFKVGDAVYAGFKLAFGSLNVPPFSDWATDPFPADPNLLLAVSVERPSNVGSINRASIILPWVQPLPIGIAYIDPDLIVLGQTIETQPGTRYINDCTGASSTQDEYLDLTINEAYPTVAIDVERPVGGDLVALEVRYALPGGCWWY
jgi:hypothetical protein